MCLKKPEWAVLAIVLLSFAIGACLYPSMPGRMASHWNTSGFVDSYTDKTTGLFLMPVISLMMFFAFVLIPRVDPLKHNIVKFRKFFDIFIVMLMVFLLYVYSLTIVWNSGVRFDMILGLMPAFVALFYYIGILLDHAQRNWFIGIRTPWTLSDERVWLLTHKKGARLFKLSALIAVLGMFAEDYAIWFLLLPVILSSAYLIVYSYFEFQKKPVKKAVRKVKRKKRK